ncbi:MAG: flagellar biosynthetic protein FliO [Clostridiaceae bacterium]|nr:flagellar biosynthetic protein FliO [Clostridiaceae bacterium]
MFLDTLGILLVFIAVLLLCYYTTRFIGRKMSGGMKNKNMRIVETLSLGPDRSLYLILVGDKHFLFFSSKKGLELVSEIDIETQTEAAEKPEESETAVFNFRRIFDTYSGLSDKKNNSPDGDVDGKGSEETRIQRSIKRLKRINANNHIRE